MTRAGRLRPIALLALMLCTPFPDRAEGAAAAADGPKANAKRDATRMYQAFARGDADEFLRFTLPALLRLMGGRDKAAPLLKPALAEMRRAQFSVVGVGEVLQLVRSGKELHVTLPLTVKMKGPDGWTRQKTYLLGVSDDNGKSWAFIDLDQVKDGDVKSLRQLVPGYSPALKIPPRAAPETVRD